MCIRMRVCKFHVNDSHKHTKQRYLSLSVCVSLPLSVCLSVCVHAHMHARKHAHTRTREWSPTSRVKMTRCPTMGATGPPAHAQRSVTVSHINKAFCLSHDQQTLSHIVGSEQAHTAHPHQSIRIAHVNIAGHQSTNEFCRHSGL